MKAMKSIKWRMAKSKNRKKIIAAAIIAAVGFLAILSIVFKSTLGDASYKTIIDFEIENPVYRINAEAGASWESLGLPETLRAVVKIEESESETEIEEADAATPTSLPEEREEKEKFRQTKPGGEDADYGKYGYRAPDDEDELREAGELVVYSFGGDCRVYGTYNGENEGFYAWDDELGIIGMVKEIPVVWSGLYDGGTAGEYILTAEFEGYKFEGEAPTVVIVIEGIEEDEGNEEDEGIEEETQRPSEASPATPTDLEKPTEKPTEEPTEEITAEPTQEEPEPTEEETEPPTEPDEPAEPENGSISGFLWVDDENSDEVTDEPVPDYPVMLYSSDDLSTPIASTQTDENGMYIFDNLIPGGYILELVPAVVDGVEYLLPTEITEDNKFEVDPESEPQAAYTEVIKLSFGQSIEEVNAGLIMPLASTLIGDTIDLHLLTANKSGNGWSYDNTTTTITFNSAASDTEYTIIRSDYGSTPKHITVNADVNDITIRYDGPNIKVTGYPNNTAPNYYWRFTSNITIKGGDGNTIIYDQVKNICDSVLTIDAAATNTTVIYDHTTHLIHANDTNQGQLRYALTNNGKNTTVIFDSVSLRRVDFDHKSAANNDKATMYLRGTNNVSYLFRCESVANSNLDIFLAGSSTFNGYIVGPNTNITIDSETAPGSESGTLTITSNATGYATIGGTSAATSGNIVINGGTLNVTNNEATGAGIGGGAGQAGKVTINSGKVTVKMNHNVSNAGAGIGGGSGTYGVGHVTITGGNIDVSSAYLGSGTGGASIGGGAYAPGNVTITGGNIKAIAGRGAAIGNGAGDNLHSAGNIVIQNAKINAASSGGAAIGVGEHTINTVNKSNFDICHTADIIGFGKGLFNPLYGIIGDGNNGDAHFVNLYYYFEQSGVKFMFKPGDIIYVYADGDKTTPLRVVQVPYEYTGFVFTTGTTTKQDYNIYVGTPTGGMKQLVQNGWLDPVIHSVNKMNKYINNVGTPVSWQWVVIANGTTNNFTVTEIHVDANGNRLPNIPDNPVMVSVNTGYNRPVTGLPGYITIGHKWDNPPSSISDVNIIKSGNATKSPITKAEEVYFIYRVDPGTANVTVSKTVTGIPSNPPKEFTFTVSFKNDQGAAATGQTFSYTGGTLPNTGASPPANSTITTNGYGEATFTLKHGQTITIANVMADYQIKIVESKDSEYKVTYTDSGDVSDPGDQDMAFKAVGTANRTIAFVNKRLMPPPTGVDAGNVFAEILLPVSILLIFSATSGLYIFIRERAKKKQPNHCV